jgi:hypothetical protein
MATSTNPARRATTAVAVHPRAARAQAESLRYLGARLLRSFVARRGGLKSRGESRLGSDRVLKNSFSEGRRLTFANFCSNFLCFLLFRSFAAFPESARDNRPSFNRALLCKNMTPTHVDLREAVAK